MSINIYETQTLAGVIRNTKPSVPGFWLNFATRQFNFDTEEIHFDVVQTDNRRVAPYVMPTVAGKPQRDTGYETQKYKPAYVKIHHTIDPSRTLSRTPGEAYGGTQSPMQRQQALLAAYMRDQRDAIERRWNLMVAEVMLYGILTVEDEAYPRQVIDFGRAANHSITLAAGSRWGDSGIDPLDNLEDWGIRMQDACNYPADVVIMGTAAWAKFRKAQGLKDLLDIRRGAEQVGGLNIAPGSGAPLQYKGSDGNRQFWVYRETYDLNETTTVEIMDPRDVLMVATGGLDLARCFGAILDVDVLRPDPIFTKSWVTEEPSRRNLLSQSAPLMVPGRPNATLRARVTA